MYIIRHCIFVCSDGGIVCLAAAACDVYSVDSVERHIAAFSSVLSAVGSIAGWRGGGGGGAVVFTRLDWDRIVGIIFCQ